MKKIEDKYQFIIDYFEKTNPNPTTELDYENTFQLVVATLLSAQCTDKRVNMVTPSLFERYPTAKEMATASQSEIYAIIKSVTYPNSKSGHLLELSKMIVHDFNGNVPDNREDLQQLPGIGRKSANVILSVAFGQPAMPVDTHVFRVANRLGLVQNAKNPLDTEQQLVAHFPEHYLSHAHHWLILHGRYVCTARNPKCETCPLQLICDAYQQRNDELTHKK